MDASGVDVWYIASRWSRVTVIGIAINGPPRAMHRDIRATYVFRDATFMQLDLLSPRLLAPSQAPVSDFFGPRRSRVHRRGEHGKAKLMARLP